eukprot:jgi/Phyca11/575031/estExt2_Genewise1.C_PHYCAscaffold_680082
MCQLCGGDSFKFAPCMLFCSGPCAGRIRRHTHYYSDPRGEHHWCSSCYKQMKDGPIDMSLLPQLSMLKKSSLIKRKNSEVAEEPWVECDSCKLWYHQICALFNERNHAISGEQEPFVCPICVKKQRAAGVKPSMDNGLKAKRLPITRMAKLIETRVMEAIEKAGEDEAVRMGNMGNSDSIGFSNGTKESASDTQFGITIREVLSIDKQVQVKPRMADKKAASASSSLSLQLTYRSRCICVFQELDGVDVLIFTLYVQEYGPDSLSPNAGRVYVSYLDSVNYFQPKKLRTLMHQQVMLGFLEDCKNRGFHTCHIWSCPPLKGDDYIFFCKPENQKIPKSARLRQWYQKLLVQAKHDGLVVNISNLYAEYYLKKKAAHELPYFEGDYWPRLAEDLIKQLEEKDNGNRAKTDGTNAGDAAPKGSSASGATAELAELDLQEIKFEAALNFVDPMQEEEEEVQVKQEGHMDSEKDNVKTESPDEKLKENGDAEAEAGVTDTKEASDKPADDLDDVIMPCEIFDTREAFLLYCQNNHCQFDQIRRAKHSSMMVLYHLFNQGTTGFTFSCSNCKTTLLSGNRWNCSICPVFNLCDSCHTKTKHEHQLHLFKVVSIPRPDNEVANETKRRIHNIDPQLLLQLEHASSCTVPNCTFFNCNRMQAMLKHGAICEQRLAGPCVLCKRIIGLLSAHARQCTKDYATCKVPRCADIRRHFLAQVQARQQQLQRARELQAQQAANGAVATTDAASAPAASATEKTDPAT